MQPLLSLTVLSLPCCIFAFFGELGVGAGHQPYHSFGEVSTETSLDEDLLDDLKFYQFARAPRQEHGDLMDTLFDGGLPSTPRQRIFSPIFRVSPTSSSIPDYDPADLLLETSSQASVSLADEPGQIKLDQLPDDVLERILQPLSSSEFMQFSQVSKASNQYTKHSKRGNVLRGLNESCANTEFLRNMVNHGENKLDTLNVLEIPGDLGKSVTKCLTAIGNAWTELQSVKTIKFTAPWNDDVAMMKVVKDILRKPRCPITTIDITSISYLTTNPNKILDMVLDGSNIHKLLITTLQVSQNSGICSKLKQGLIRELHLRFIDGDYLDTEQTTISWNKFVQCVRTSKNLKHLGVEFHQRFSNRFSALLASFMTALRSGSHSINSFTAQSVGVKLAPLVFQSIAINKIQKFEFQGLKLDIPSVKAMEDQFKERRAQDKKDKLPITQLHLKNVSADTGMQLHVISDLVNVISNHSGESLESFILDGKAFSGLSVPSRVRSSTMTGAYAIDYNTLLSHLSKQTQLKHLHIPNNHVASRELITQALNVLQPLAPQLESLIITEVILTPPSSDALVKFLRASQQLRQLHLDIKEIEFASSQFGGILFFNEKRMIARQFFESLVKTKSLKSVDVYGRILYELVGKEWAMNVVRNSGTVTWNGCDVMGAVKLY